MKWNQACCLLSCVIFKLHCWGHFHLLHHFHVTFSEHSIPLRVIKVSNYFSFSFLRWNVSSVWSRPLWQKSLPLGSVSGEAANLFLFPAIEQLTHLTPELMITMDSWSGDHQRTEEEHDRWDLSNPRWKIGPVNENSENSLIRKWKSTLCADHPLFTCLYRLSSESDRERENLGFTFAVLLKSILSCHCCLGNRMQIKPSEHPKPHKISSSRPHMHICTKTPLGRRREDLYSCIYCSKEW